MRCYQLCLLVSLHTQGLPVLEPSNGTRAGANRRAARANVSRVLPAASQRKITPLIARRAPPAGANRRVANCNATFAVPARSASTARASVPYARPVASRPKTAPLVIVRRAPRVGATRRVVRANAATLSVFRELLPPLGQHPAISVRTTRSVAALAPPPATLALMS